jgi:1-acyl-sn-glycerol-3-phosphate acyltransferase
MRLLRCFTFVSSLLILGALFLPLALVPAPRRWHLKSRLLGAWARWILPRIGIHISEAPDHVPPHTARVIVANHISYLDIPLLLARGPCLFLGKEEILSWPIIGWIARRSGMVFVKRSDLWSRARSILSLQQRLQAGISVVVFPEGTTSLEGPRKGWAAFFSGAFRAARMESCPLELVYIEYDRPEICAWLGDDSFVTHLWQFLARPRTHVRLRSEMIYEIPDRATQRESSGFSRRWMLSAGRNSSHTVRPRSRPEVDKQAVRAAPHEDTFTLAPWLAHDGIVFWRGTEEDSEYGTHAPNPDPDLGG